jgi:hypothetical protein
MSASQEVSRILMQDVAVSRCLANGLINTRALAKFLMKKYSLSYSEEALVSAIRRYKPDVAQDEVVENVLDNAMLFIKSNIFCLDTSVQDQAKIGNILIDETLNKNIRVSRGKKSTKLIGYEKECDKLKGFFLDSQIVSLQKDLVEIRIMLDNSVKGTVGVFSTITSHVALYGVSLQEVIISLPELFLYVKHDDALVTQKALMEIIGKKR